jgi:hypothetical protein
MLLEQAIILLKQGSRIKRTSSETIRCISIDHTGKLFEIVYKDGRTVWHQWSLSVQDLLADDYEIVI